MRPAGLNSGVASQTPVGNKPADFVSYWRGVEQELPERLKDFKIERTRTFQADPSTLLVRWRMSFRSAKDDKGRVIVDASSTFKISKVGLVYSQVDRWDLSSDMEGQSLDPFQDWLDLALAFRPQVLTFQIHA